MRLLLAIVALSVACGAEPPLSPALRQALASITANDLKADVSFLASDLLEGRATPSRGLDIAAEYIAAQFRRAGLEPAGDDGYFQTAEYVSVTPKTEGLALSIETGGTTFQAAAEKIFIQNARELHLRRAAGVKLALEGEVREADVEGKLVVVTARELYTALRRVNAVRPQLARAAAILIAADSVPARPPRARLVEAGEQPGPAVLATGDPELVRHLEGAAEAPVISLEMPEPAAERVRLRNVAGLVRGSDPALKDSYVIVSAHYDHTGVRSSGDGDRIFNGANDDASGTASVIAAAHAIAMAPPRRSVLFIAWFGEEVGGYGARYYVRHPLAPLASTVANVNLEQTGRTDDSRGPVVNAASLTGFDFSDAGRIMAEAGLETGVKIYKDEKRSDDFFSRSDNLTLAMAGIPAHTLCVAYEYPDYHRVSDEWPKLDYGNMERVTRAIAAGVWTIAERLEPVRWNESNPKTTRFVQARKAEAPVRERAEWNTENQNGGRKGAAEPAHGGKASRSPRNDDRAMSR